MKMRDFGLIQIDYIDNNGYAAQLSMTDNCFQGIYFDDINGVRVYTKSSKELYEALSLKKGLLAEKNFEIALLRKRTEDDRELAATHVKMIDEKDAEISLLKEKLGRGCPIDGYDGCHVMKERDTCKGRIADLEKLCDILKATIDTQGKEQTNLWKALRSQEKYSGISVDPLTGIAAEFKVNGIYIPVDAFFCCPECSESSPIHECEGWPTCPVCGEQLQITNTANWIDPDTGKPAILNLSPLKGHEKTAKIERILPRPAQKTYESELVICPKVGLRSECRTCAHNKPHPKGMTDCFTTLAESECPACVPVKQPAQKEPELFICPDRGSDCVCSHVKPHIHQPDCNGFEGDCGGKCVPVKSPVPQPSPVPTSGSTAPSDAGTGRDMALRYLDSLIRQDVKFNKCLTEEDYEKIGNALWEAFGFKKDPVMAKDMWNLTLRMDDLRSYIAERFAGQKDINSNFLKHIQTCEPQLDCLRQNMVGSEIKLDTRLNNLESRLETALKKIQDEILILSKNSPNKDQGSYFTIDLGYPYKTIYVRKSDLK